MSDLGAGLARVPAAGVKPGTGRVVLAAALASLIAGVTGVALVLGRGALELPVFAWFGLVYAFVPGVPVLLAIHYLLPDRPMPVWRSQAAYGLLAAAGAVLWFLPFMGLYVPVDRPDAPAAIATMALYHASAGATGGLAFWLLTRRT